MRRHMAGPVLLLAGGCGTPHEPGEYLASGVQSCELAECHAAVERIHLGGQELSCTDCHGGNPVERLKETAHVTVDISYNPSTPGNQFLGEPSLQEMDLLSLAVIQFLNPADYRVARQTCGTNKLGGATCHGAIVESSLLMNRATLAGQLAGGGFIAGTQDKHPRYSVVDAVDIYSPEQPIEGRVKELVELPPECPSDGTDDLARAYFPIYEQQCLECHLYRDGEHTPGLYYSSGCNACHMITENESRAHTADITQDTEELGHVAKHRFTNLVPDKQCAHCHISHLARSLLAQGVRERSEHEGDEAIGGPNRGVEDPEEVVPWGEEHYVRYQGQQTIYGKPYPFFIEDEDGTNDIDETPPDVHTAAGMGCIDCHNIREAHGDGTMAERMDHELDVRCESCHGRPGELATLFSDDNLPFNQALTSKGDEGANITVMERASDDTVMQKVRFTGALHPVTQIAHRTDPADATHNTNTLMGCALHAGTAEERARIKAEVNALTATDPAAVPDAFPGLPEGFSFDVVAEETAGRTECFSCHNAWTLNCYGCHQVRDDRQTYVSKLDGETKLGRASNLGLSVVSDSLSLGFNARGKITPMIGTSIFFTHIDANGDRPFDAVALLDGDGLAGQGNVHNPVHHHTIQQKPRDCTGCHPSEGVDNETALLTATGLGSGRFVFEDGTGAEHILDRTVFADWDGNGEADDPRDMGLPDALYAVWPAASTTHTPLDPDGDTPSPGPLDLDTIHRLLDNHVVDQRAPTED